MICMPALLYLLLCTIQIILDFMNGLYNTAFVKMIVTIIITFFLNILCEMDLGFISWIIVLIPFLFMTLIVSIILYALGYDIATGKTIQPIEQEQQEQYYLQTGYTSPPIPPKFLPEVVTTFPPNKNPPIEEKNIYLISYNPNQQQLPIPYPDIHVYNPPTPPTPTPPGPTPIPPGPTPIPPGPTPIPGPPPTPPPKPTPTPPPKPPPTPPPKPTPTPPTPIPGPPEPTPGPPPTPPPKPPGPKPPGPNPPGPNPPFPQTCSIIGNNKYDPYCQTSSIVNSSCDSNCGTKIPGLGNVCCTSQCCSTNRLSFSPFD